MSGYRTITGNYIVWFGKVWLLANDFVVAVVHQQPNEIALHALNDWQSRGVIFYFQAA